MRLDHAETSTGCAANGEQRVQTIELSLVELLFPSYQGLWLRFEELRVFKSFNCLVPVTTKQTHLPGYEINQVTFLIVVLEPKMSDDDDQSLTIYTTLFKMVAIMTKKRKVLFFLFCNTSLILLSTSLSLFPLLVLP